MRGILLLSLVLMISAGCGQNPPGAAATVPPESCEPVPGDFSRYTLLTGEVAARDALMITVPSAPFWPMTARWLIDDGTVVEAGQKIAEFDGTQLLARVDALEAEVTTATNQLSSTASRGAADLADLELEVAQKTAQRDKAQVEARLPEELVPARELAEKRMALEKAELELNGALAKLKGRREAQLAAVEIEKLALERARQELTEVHATLQRMTVTAPTAGIFFAGDHPREPRLLQSGDALWSGYRIGRIPGNAAWQVEARLFDVDEGRVLPGQEVAAFLDAEPGQKLHGKVYRIDDIAQETSRGGTRRAFKVLIEIDEFAASHPGGLATRLRPGMSLRLEVQEATRRVPVVPRGCLASLPAEKILACGSLLCEVAP